MHVIIDMPLIIHGLGDHRSYFDSHHSNGLEAWSPLCINNRNGRICLLGSTCTVSGKAMANQLLK